MRSWFVVAVCAAMGCGRIGFDATSIDAPPPIPIAASGQWAGTADLERTLAISTSRTSFTFSSWFKGTVTGVFFDAGIGAGNHSELKTIGVTSVPSLDHLEGPTEYEAGPDYGGAPFPLDGLWTHLVVSLDTAQADDAQRVHWWVNGEPQAISSGTRLPFTQDLQLYLGDTLFHTLGCKFDRAFQWSGAMAETYVIWGQTLDANAFVVMTPDGPRSIAYTGPVTAESFYFDYAVLGQNRLPGQPDWVVNGVTSSNSDLPY